MEFQIFLLFNPTAPQAAFQCQRATTTSLLCSGPLTPLFLSNPAENPVSCTYPESNFCHPLTANTLVATTITPWLDYCYSLLNGLFFHFCSPIGHSQHRRRSDTAIRSQIMSWLLSTSLISLPTTPPLPHSVLGTMPSLNMPSTLLSQDLYTGCCLCINILQPDYPINLQ